MRKVVKKVVDRLRRRSVQCRVFLDQPSEALFAQNALVLGWYAGADEIETIRLNGVTVIEYELVDRPDVERECPTHVVVTGFRFNFDTSGMPGCEALSIEIVDIKGRSVRGEFPLGKNPSWELKQSKLLKLGEILLMDMPHKRTLTGYDFLGDDLVKMAGLVSSVAVSSHNYSDEMVAEIRRVPKDGWVLDCGAGYRKTEYSNVVLFEVEPYVSTDVRGICEALPFKDDSFDLILSIVVLEHVKDPFLAAKEMRRVLKPGGRIWIDVAFMQPYHGYPNHYYNMTKDGLRNLFFEGFAVVREFVPNYGEPFWSLSWILQVYFSGIDDESKQQFRDLTLGEIMDSSKQLGEEAWLRNLPEGIKSSIAATHSLLVEKR